MLQVTLALTENEIELLRKSMLDLPLNDTVSVSLQLKVANALLDAKYMQSIKLHVNSTYVGSLSDFPALTPVRSSRFHFCHVDRSTLVAYQTYVATDEVVYVGWSKCRKDEPFSKKEGLQRAWDRIINLRETGQCDPLPNSIRTHMVKFLETLSMRYKNASFVVSQ